MNRSKLVIGGLVFCLLTLLSATGTQATPSSRTVQVATPTERAASRATSRAPLVAPLAPIIVADEDTVSGHDAALAHGSLINVGDNHRANATQPIDRSSRSAVRNAYNTRLVPALKVPIGWNGKLSTCRIGAPSAAAQQATLDAINYFRAMASMEAVTFDPALSQKAQAAALVMEANGMLSHHPDPSWKCWSQLAYDGASSSNIALGYAGAEAVAAYMEDYGAGNIEVGHRQWLLHPQATTMGSGSTTNANAVAVFGGRNLDVDGPKVVTWPPAGWVPSPIEPSGRWSFGLPFADADALNNATVTVRETSGKAVSTTLEHRGFSRYGMGPYLVFNVKGVEVKPKHMDRHFRVTISNIHDPSMPSTYTYYVQLFDPSTTTPPTSNPPPGQQPPSGAVVVTGRFDGIAVNGRTVTLYGSAVSFTGKPTLTIYRGRTTLATITASRPRSDSSKGWQFKETVAPGTYTYCVDFTNTNFSPRTLQQCRQVTVK